MSVQLLTRNDPLLRRVLLLNAMFETTLGIGGIIAANALAEWTQLLTPTLFTLLGVGCLSYSALFYWMVAQPQINRSLARAVMLFNDAFAVAAILLLIVAWGSFTEGGRWLIGTLAVDAGILAALEFEGLRRIREQKEAIS
jgi:hypothetical protein